MVATDELLYLYTVPYTDPSTLHLTPSPMAALSKSLLLLGIKGHVVALEKGTGREIWRTRLTRGDFVNIVTDGNVIFATTSGEVFCLDAGTGTVLWKNPMKGLGLGVVTLLPGGIWSDGQAPVAEQVRRTKARQGTAAG